MQKEMVLSPAEAEEYRAFKKQKRMEEALRAGYEYSPEADAAKAKEARENGQIIEDCDECKLESSEE